MSDLVIVSTEKRIYLIMYLLKEFLICDHFKVYIGFLCVIQEEVWEAIFVFVTLLELNELLLKVYEIAV